MCKIDYLGEGVCPAGCAKSYVAYFPQGRMDLTDALAREAVPVTEALLDIADSCTLCGACDLPCHFYSGLRPLPVMAALKQFVEQRLRSGGRIVRPERDPLVNDLRAIVGDQWASNDPAIQLTYSNDPFPLSGPVFPRAVVLPCAAEEVAAIVRTARRHQVPFAVRGNGASVYGQVFSAGLVLDMTRMKEISFDPANWSVAIGPGVTAFELQREAAARGFRVNVAEPAATVIGNIICTGLFSTWSAAYGMGADHLLDMEFVDRAGEFWRLVDGKGPGTRFLAYRHEVDRIPGVCTRASLRLQPVTGDEEGIIVPFGEFAEAVRFARALATRRVGLSIAVLGPHYLASFLAPDRALSRKVKRTLPEDLAIAFGVCVVADGFSIETARRLAGRPVIDQQLFRKLALGLPRLVDNETLELLRAAEGERSPLDLVIEPEAGTLLEAVLDPSPSTLASAVDADLQDAYRKLYSRPELTDIVWLSSFRIISARMGRDKHIVAFILFIPLDEALAASLCDRFATVACEIGIDHDYGFLTPLDHGKRAVLEYDYYIDHTDGAERQRVAAAMEQLVPWLDGLCNEPEANMTWIKTVFTQGSARKEGWLFRNLADRCAPENVSGGGAARAHLN